MALALAAVAVIIALLWLVSVRTASKYETRTSTAAAQLNAAWAVNPAGFLAGKQAGRPAAGRARGGGLRVGGADRRPSGRASCRRPVGGGDLVRGGPGCRGCLDRLPLSGPPRGHAGSGRPAGGRRADGWCWGVLAAAVAALLTAGLVGGWTDRRSRPSDRSAARSDRFLAALLAVQVTLLVMLAVTVAVLARWSGGQPGRHRGQPGTRRYPAVPGRWARRARRAAGLLLGGLLTAVISIGVTRLLGTPVPSGFRFDIPPPDALAVPWPTYAFAAAPAGMLVGGVRRLRRCGSGTAPVRRVRADERAGPSEWRPLTRGHRGRAGRTAMTGVRRPPRAIARAWALGLSPMIPVWQPAGGRRQHHRGARRGALRRRGRRPGRSPCAAGRMAAAWPP